MQDSHDLWRLLVLITESKARRLSTPAPRPIDSQPVESQPVEHVAPNDDSRSGRPEDSTQIRLRIDEPTGITPTPEFAELAVEEMRRLLTLLNDAQLTRIAVMRMAGHTHEEIAQRVGCVPDTVGRKLRLIHNAWRQEIESR
jgi:DNA-directed RNA polymerase specialized sigma24 family protein